MKLLIVEDEEQLLETLVYGFQKKGYTVEGIADGTEALHAIESGEYDLVVLDLNLPDMDGMDILARIRAYDEEQRILILTARADFSQRVAGLDMGANDYVVKPFDFGELVARVQGLLRRRIIQQSAVVRCPGGITLDTAQRTAYAANGTAIALTMREYDILEYLALHKGTHVSAEELISHIWADDEGLFSNAVKVHMSLLRKKLRAHADCDVIHTLRNVGYVIQEDTP